MREDAVAVYIRHRNELVKSIYDGYYGRQEVGDFLLSLRNLDNHNITFDPLPVDIVCKSYSDEILKNEGDGGNENQLGLDSYTNEQVHEMSWDEIHEMAENQIERKEMY